MKKCTKCLCAKDFAQFSRRAAAKDGLQHHCKSCKLAYQKDNPNRKLVLKKYRDENKEDCNYRSRLSQAKNRSYYSQKTLEWQNINKDQYLANRRARYIQNSAAEIARVRIRAGKIRHGAKSMERAELTEVQAMYDFCRIFSDFEVDHIVPLNGKDVSGLHVLANLQVLEKSINRSKGNKLLPYAVA